MREFSCQDLVKISLNLSNNGRFGLQDVSLGSVPLQYSDDYGKEAIELNL